MPGGSWGLRRVGAGVYAGWELGFTPGGSWGLRRVGAGVYAGWELGFTLGGSGGEAYQSCFQSATYAYAVGNIRWLDCVQ